MSVNKIIENVHDIKGWAFREDNYGTSGYGWGLVADMGYHSATPVHIAAAQEYAPELARRVAAALRSVEGIPTDDLEKLYPETHCHNCHGFGCEMCGSGYFKGLAITVQRGEV